MESRTALTVNVLSMLAAAVAAGVAVWQAVEATQSSNQALQAALATQRLGTCVRMNNILETTSIQVIWADFMDKPYGKNSRFLNVTAAIHLLGEHAKLFRQMTPGEESEKFLDDVFKLRIALKDMVADGSDFMSEKQIIQSMTALSKQQKAICDKIFT
jgi:hypothetical protein